MGSKSTDSLWGGAIWPPHQKKPGSCRLGIKLGGITRVGLNFMMIQNLSHPRSLWRHSDVIPWWRHQNPSKSDIVITFEQIIPWSWLTPHFLYFGMLFRIEYISKVFGVRKVLTSAVFNYQIFDDVMMTSRHVVTSYVGFFCFESFLSLISYFCPSFKSIGLFLVKIWWFHFLPFCIGFSLISLPPSDKTGIISHRIIKMSQFFAETCKTKSK